MQNRTGLLTVRVWLEEYSGSDGLRARITQTVDLLEDTQIVTAVATTDGVYATVRDWLEAYLAN